MTQEEKNYFNELYNVNVNDKTEDKNGLTYLSWAWAWAEFCKRSPDANYEVVKFNGLPYVYDEATGYMVYTKVTILGVTREMWLAVMDSNNYAMKKEPYKVVTKYKTIDVKPATMTDINKTIMRCLTKNLAMFGLGLYIYAGEDLPEDSETATKAPETAKPTKTSKTPSEDKEKARESYNKLKAFCKENGYDIKTVAKEYKLNANSTSNDFETVLHRLVLNDALNRAKEVIPEPEEV